MFEGVARALYIPVVNRAAIVTGASRGIGRGIAIELAGLGFDLVINYVHHTRAARQTAADCVAAARTARRRIRALPCRADIARAADRERLVHFARDQFRRLDLLVNNAGIAPGERTDLLEAGEKSFDRLLSVNVKGPYFLTQKIGRWMVEQVQRAGPASTYQPRIVTISSISAYAASTDRGDYCLAKAALAMLTPLFAARLAEHGIQVFEIRPGIISTDMTAPVQAKYDKLIAAGLTPIRRWGRPEDVGKAVAAIAQGLLPFSTGEVINVDGGFHLRTL